jgi:hypothetical protein
MLQKIVLLVCRKTSGALVAAVEDEVGPLFQSAFGNKWIALDLVSVRCGGSSPGCLRPAAT